jgi:AcrR family transcriptional regulator
VTARAAAAEPAAPRRYDATRRREQAAGTRERIVTAGVEVLRDSSIRDWRALTVAAVAARAGVSERTVFRHLGDERGLRDAVMARLERETGIDLAAMRLDDVADVARRICEHVAAYPRERRAPLDPTLTDANRRQQAALLDAVSVRTPEWSAADRTLAAAVLDVLWAVASYERLVVDWELDGDEAVRGLTWAIDLVTAAVADGRPPPPAPRGATGAAGRRGRG